MKNGEILSAGECVGSLCEEAAHALGLVPGIKVGSGVIDAYAGWVGELVDFNDNISLNAILTNVKGTVGAKVELDDDTLADNVPDNNMEQAFTRVAAVAGTSTCHLVMSKNPVFVPGVWGPYRDVLLPDFWMAEGGQSSTGSLLNHVLTTHPAHVTAMAEVESQKTNIFELLNARLLAMQKEENVPSISYLARHYFFYGDHHGNRRWADFTFNTSSLLNSNICRIVLLQIPI